MYGLTDLSSYPNKENTGMDCIIYAQSDTGEPRADLGDKETRYNNHLASSFVTFP